MSDGRSYVLDADSFIRSKREHYAFDICPGYWDALIRGFRQGILLSIEPVRRELVRGSDALANWVKHHAPEGFFETIDVPAVQGAYAKVAQWTDENKDYTRPAKQKFLSGADPWLVAFRQIENRLDLVTYEVSEPESKGKIKLPDVAKHFDVDSVRPYVMLRKLGIVLRLEP